MFVQTNLRDLSAQAEIVLVSAVEAGRVPQPFVLAAAPGAGKTFWCTRGDIKGSLPQLYAAALGVDVADIGIVVEKPARRDAAELAGVALPMEDDDGTVYTQFTESPVIRKIKATGKEFGILVWDEGMQAGMPEQKVLADSLDPEEHSIGGTPIPKGWIVVMTGNRAHDKAGALKLLSHNVNRALCCEVQFDAIGWRDDFAIPQGINPVVIDCAMAHVENGFFADAVPVEQTSYCTPRSLVAASRHLDAFMASPEFTGTIPPRVERLLAMNIGEAAANTLCQWIAQRDQVPTVEEIMADPETAKVPDQTGFQQIAAHRAMAAINDSRSATQVLHYVRRLRRDLQVSLGVKLMRLVADKGWVSTDPVYAQFIEQFNEYLPLTFED